MCVWGGGVLVYELASYVVHECVCVCVCRLILVYKLHVQCRYMYMHVLITM